MSYRKVRAGEKVFSTEGNHIGTLVGYTRDREMVLELHSGEIIKSKKTEPESSYRIGDWSEKLFARHMDIKQSLIDTGFALQRAASIVQNSGITITEYDLDEYTAIMNEIDQKLSLYIGEIYKLTELTTKDIIQKGNDGYNQ
jgi:hypothetical protein